MTKAYTFHDYNTAAWMLYDCNDFLYGFGSGIKNLIKPINPDTSDIADRRNPESYYKNYYERFKPLLSRALGKYQREVLNTIKDERGIT